MRAAEPDLLLEEDLAGWGLEQVSAHARMCLLDAMLPSLPVESKAQMPLKTAGTRAWCLSSHAPNRAPELEPVCLEEHLAASGAHH